METKWLEDFVTLAQTGSFSKAAKLRNVTQPAFSRRIQALEAWLGCELIDRGAYPTRMSPQGQVFYEQALAVMDQIRQTRTIVRGGSAYRTSSEFIHMVVPHTLAFSHCPRWFEGLRSRLCHSWANLTFKLTTSNVHDAVQSFIDGLGDFLVFFHHQAEPIEFDLTKFEVKKLGMELFQPYSAVNSKGLAKYRLDATSPLPVPILNFARPAYLSHLQNACMRFGPEFRHEVVFETDMSECIKAMCARGAGVAWLPESLVGDDPRSGLVPLVGPYRTELEIRLVRRPGVDEGSERKRLLERAWHLWPD